MAINLSSIATDLAINEDELYLAVMTSDDEYDLCGIVGAEYGVDLNIETARKLWAQHRK